MRGRLNPGNLGSAEKWTKGYYNISRNKRQFSPAQEGIEFLVSEASILYQQFF